MQEKGELARHKVQARGVDRGDVSVPGAVRYPSHLLAASGAIDRSLMRVLRFPRISHTTAIAFCGLWVLQQTKSARLLRTMLRQRSRERSMRREARQSSARRARSKPN